MSTIDSNPAINPNETVEYRIEQTENKFIPEYHIHPFAETKSTRNLMEKTDIVQSSLSSENIISEVEGVITNIEEEIVSVKFEENLTVEFPKFLFDNIEHVNYGKSLIYQIKINEKGYRYQNFIPAEIQDNSLRNEIMDLLDDV